MEKPKKSALNVMDGIDQPGQINPDLINRLRSKRTKTVTVDEYVEGILAGNRTLLSKAITLVESSLPRDQALARQIIDQCLKAGPAGAEKDLKGKEEFKIQNSKFKCQNSKDQASGQDHQTGQSVDQSVSQSVNQSISQSVNQSVNHFPSSIRIGITGVPGVGKSTFIEALGMHLVRQGHRLAVLAIDPSSTRSKGSILGDKTRMEELSVEPNAFIRPSPSAGSLGGVARKTRETIILCEAAGFDVIFVETVGVGQSETAVHSMVDFFLLLMLAGAGDELQGIKRGIIEMADAIFINKADGDNLVKAKAARVEYANALHLFPPASGGWQPVVDVCSARSGLGIVRVWEVIGEYKQKTRENGYFMHRRMDQNRQIMRETIETGLHEHFFSRKEIAGRIRQVDQDILSGRANPYAVAQELLERYFRGDRDG